MFIIERIYIGKIFESGRVFLYQNFYLLSLYCLAAEGARASTEWTLCGGSIKVSLLFCIVLQISSAVCGKSMG